MKQLKQLVRNGWIHSAVGATNGAATDKLVAALEACGCDAAKEILAQKDYPGQEIPVDLRW